MNGISKIALRSWVFFLLTIVSVNLHAQEKLESRGSLVVVPKNHSKPIPFEAAEVWQTGSYRNFFKLPCVSEIKEPRSEFNRPYGCYAQKWLSVVKEISTVLYDHLIKAANTTHFKIISDYIRWEHIPYPDGEIDYKKYEKAAFYNGEIILSTPVMDRIGPLENVLTAEQNQGYVVIHELINAAYPDKSVEWKLNLGEVILQKVMFGQSKKEALLSLIVIDLNYISAETDQDFVRDVLLEAKKYKGIDIQGFDIMYDYVLAPKRSLRKGLETYLEDNNVFGYYGFSHWYGTFRNGYLKWATVLKSYSEEAKSFFDSDYIMYLSQKFKVELSKFEYVYELYSWEMLGNVVQPVIADQVSSAINKALDDYIESLSQKSSSEVTSSFLKISYPDMFNHTHSDALEFFESLVSSDVKKIDPYFNVYRFVEREEKNIKQKFDVAFIKVFEARDIDLKRTKEFYAWLQTDDNCSSIGWNRFDDRALVNTFPLREGDRLYQADSPYMSNNFKANRLYRVAKIKSRKNYPLDVKVKIIEGFDSGEYVWLDCAKAKSIFVLK